MLRRVFAILLLAAVPLIRAAGSPQLDRIVEEARQAFQVPGIAVAIVHRDAVIYAKGFGVKSLPAGAPVTPATRFAIGSTTKAFTTAAMGILIDEGKMSWDDPVRKHLPYFALSDPLADANVTMRDIVCHRTGISRNDLLVWNSPWTREQVIRRIPLLPLDKPFRGAFQYESLMFLAAGQATGLAAGTTWEKFVAARILEPLGMRNTDFSANDAMKSPDHATPHEKRDGKVTAIPWLNIDNTGPAGSINSSVEDLSRWVRMQLNEGVFEGKRLLKAETLREMHTPQVVIRIDDPILHQVNIGTHMAAYGLGWIIQDYRGHRMVSHGGVVDGFRALVTLLPEDRYGVIILANLRGNDMPECLRASIVDELLGLPQMDWNKRYLDAARQAEEKGKKWLPLLDAWRHQDTKPSRELAAYAGLYRHPAYGDATVVANGAALELRWSNWKVPLEHYHFDVFRAGGETIFFRDSLVRFQLNDVGTVQTVRFINQEFQRKP